MSTMRRPLAEYLATAYPFTTIADDTGFFVSFSDLPGCITQVDRIEDVGPAAAEIQKLWLATAYDQGLEIPEPSAPASYSGKFVLRLPRSLHRSLAESAAREGVSLNHYVTTLLAAGVAMGAGQRLDHVEPEIDLPQARARTTSIGGPGTPAPPALRGTG